MTFTDIETKEEKALSAKLPSVLERVKTLVIKTAEDYKDAMKDLRGIKVFIKEAKEYWKDPVESAHKAHVSVKAKANAMINPAEAAEKTLKFKIDEYDKELERQAKIAQDAANAKAKAEADKLLARAETQAAKGNEAAAEALRERAVMAEAIVPVIPTPEKEEGVSKRKKHTIIVENIELLPREYMIPNQKLLDSMAQTTNGTIKIPGCRVNTENVMSVRL